MLRKPVTNKRLLIIHLLSILYEVPRTRRSKSQLGQLGLGPNTQNCPPVGGD